MNGALFMTRDVLGNVRISGITSSTPTTGSALRSAAIAAKTLPAGVRRTNGFEITGNTFEYVRDNPIEPENHAAFWIVKHNAFVNSYAAISTDGVSGNDLLVFAILFTLGGGA